MKRLPPAGRKHKLDFLGAALVMAAAMLFLLALTTGGTRVPWISPTIFALVGGSIAAHRRGRAGGSSARRSRSCRSTCWPIR